MSDDYDEYERACDAMREDNVVLLEEFTGWLRRKGLSEKTVDRHRDNTSTSPRGTRERRPDTRAPRRGMRLQARPVGIPAAPTLQCLRPTPPRRPRLTPLIG